MKIFSCLSLLLTVCCLQVFLIFSANALPATPDVEGKVSGTAMLGGNIGFENGKLTAGLSGGSSLRGFLAGLVNMGKSFLDMIRGKRGIDSTGDEGGMSFLSGTGGLGRTTGTGGLRSTSSIGAISTSKSMNSGSVNKMKESSRDGSVSGSSSYFRSQNEESMESTNDGGSAIGLGGVGAIGGLSSSRNIGSSRTWTDRSSVQVVNGLQSASGADDDGGMKKLTNINYPIMDSKAVGGNAVMGSAISSKRIQKISMTNFKGNGLSGDTGDTDWSEK